MPTATEEGTVPDWLSTFTGALDPKTRLPKWVEPSSLPQLAIQGRVAAPGEVVAIVENLRLLDEEAVKATLLPPVVSALRNDAERNSLDAFTCALYERYHEAGRPRSDRWINHATPLLGGDRCALKIAAKVKQWAEDLNRVGANLGIEMLRAIGSDTALMQLDTLARKVRRNSVKERAQKAVEEIAAARGLTLEQLADRIVPDCGLDEKGSRCFDFGPRQFWFVSGPGMEPRVRDEKGSVLVDLPKPRQSDDPALATESVAAWKLLKKSLREIWKVQGERLEQAMVIGRRWATDEFERFFLRHPLMRHLSRLLVWAEYGEDGAVRQTFRVGEDLAFVSHTDDALSSGLSGRVGIVHPLQLSSAELCAWGQILSDYDLLPPFDQINRTTYRLEPGEESQTELKRHTGVEIHPMSLLSKLTRLGWVRGEPENAGVFSEHRRYFASEDITAILRYSGGISIMTPGESDAQTIEGCQFLAGWREPKAWDHLKDSLLLRDVPALVISETVRDLALLTANAR